MAKELSDFMCITPKRQRMDSLMVAANIRNLSMLELFYTCAANLAKIMNQRETENAEQLCHYIEKDDYNRFIYHQLEQDATGRTIIVMYDAETFIEQCNATSNFDDTSEYQLLIHLRKERTILDNDGSRRLRKKEEVEEPSKALLNPSDQEATFRYKAGSKPLGYVGNITEAVGDSGSIVADYAYEQNIYSDNQFLNDYLARPPIYDEPVLLVADGAYSGERNVAIASEHQIKFIAANFTRHKPDDIYSNFIFSKEGKYLLECINGCAPESCTYDSGNDRSAAYFSHEVCAACPYRDKCQPRFLKTRVRKEVSWKAVNRAKQLRYMKTDEFNEYAHFRNGVESIPSLLRWRYNRDKIPAHGKKQTRIYFGFKIAALNFQKLRSYRWLVELHPENRSSIDDRIQSYHYQHFNRNIKPIRVKFSRYKYSQVYRNMSFDT